MSELQEQVEQIRAGLEQLREASGDGPGTRKLFDSLFRTAHNLKARALTNGLDDLARVAHEFENILHSLRIGKVRLDDDALRLLAEAANRLSSSRSNAQRDTPLVDRVVPPHSNADAEGLINTVPEELRTSLNAAERHRLNEAVREGSTLYFVEANFHVTDFDRQFQDLKERLNDNGEVISTAPKQQTNNTDTIYFGILYASAAEVDKIQHLLNGIPNVTVNKASRGGSIDEIFREAVRAGESAAVALGKEIDFVVSSASLYLEKSQCEALADPLLHLVRNAVGHGIETSDERFRLGKNSRGTIVVEAVTAPGGVRITVTDDGRGIDPAIIGKVFQPGFSTAAEVSMISGRGVGLDVVLTAVKNIGGSVRVESEPGKGTTFEIKLPLK